MKQTEQGVDKSYDYASVSRWTRAALRPLFANRLAFVPVNVEQQHWILVVIDFELHTITLYDPFDVSSHARSILKVFLKPRYLCYIINGYCDDWIIHICVNRSLFYFRTVRVSERNAISLR